MKKRKFIKNGAKIHKSAIIDESVKIINPKNLIIGKNVRIDANVLLICKKKLKINSNVHVGPNSILRSHKKLNVGKNVLISSFVDIFTSESDVRSIKTYSHPMIKINKKNDQKIDIGAFSFLGSHCVLLPGSKLSRGSYIGAHTLINFKTKPWHIYSGNPPKVIGKINRSEAKKIMRIK
tara:strand:+ start:1767 stop:2303 length:537 start_codon:yes stop_codon:yes gene_type:complete